MGEPGAASHAADLVSMVGSVLEEFGVTEALTLAGTVALYRDHPRWAVWLPAPGGGQAAVRPADSRPPGPEVPMLWVQAAVLPNWAHGRIRQMSACRLDSKHLRRRPRVR